MSITNNKSFKWLFVFLHVSIFLLTGGRSYAQDSKYPIRLEIIDKSQAKYDTPENTLTAKISALLKKDLEWYYETLTKESAAINKKLFQEAGIDPAKNFEMVDEGDQNFIIDKIQYKNGFILVGKIVGKDGSILIGPAVFIKEDGLWKQTTEYNTDEELWKYRDYFPSLFDGKGQRPADVNTFFAYANPLQMRTELPAGTAKFSLHIFYGETIDPATFKAELNKQDISSQFNPKPVGDQVVKLNLRKGRNVLLLSIEGKRKDGKTTKDSDRLVFIVP